MKKSYTINSTFAHAGKLAFLALIIILQSYSSSAQLSLTISGTNVSCFGGSNGSATVTAAGGTAPYTYSWSPSGGNAATATGLIAGSYTVTVTDNASQSNTATISITEPTALTASIVVTNNLCSHGTNGAINLTPSGGTAGYTYDWGGAITTQNRTGLEEGIYSVTITDANGCTFTTSATLVDPPNISASTTETNALCHGDSTGTIILTPNGGTGSYTYDWGGGITTKDILNAHAGTHSVIITDANGCTYSTSTTIYQPLLLIGSTVVTNVLCSGNSTGSIIFSPSGGTAGYAYNWGGSITTKDITNAPIGIYTITLTDSKGCTFSTSDTITEPTAISATTTVTNVLLCNGDLTGAINLTPSGGVGGFTYNWGGGITTKDRSGLAAGIYTVSVTDTNGCVFTTSATVTQPLILTATTAVTNVLCNGGLTGSIILNPSGGTAGYTYNWGGAITTKDRVNIPAGPYAVTITDTNGCLFSISDTVTEPNALTATTTVTNVLCNGGSSGSIVLSPSGGAGGNTYNWGGGIITQNRTNLAAGPYAVTITDANGCTFIRNDTVTEPTLITATAIVTNVLCNGDTTGAIDLTPSGGVGPYTFNWGFGVTTKDRINLAAGPYSVTITDANGCSVAYLDTVTQPTAISATTIVTDVLCFGGSTGTIDLTPSGGVGGYTFDWGGGITTEDRTGLFEGIYSVNITDANGCLLTASATVNEPNDIVATMAITNPLCFGDSNGAIVLTPSGGTPGYTYDWGGAITTKDRTGLPEGIYFVTITDANGCVYTTSDTLTDPLVLSATTAVTDVVLCYGDSSGEIDLTPSGGTAAYTYNWGGGVTTEDRAGLAAGIYSVTITDANGCVFSISDTVNQPTLITATTTATDVLCNGGLTGAIDLDPAGGTPGYTYSWGGSVTTKDRTGLAAGIYSVTITDANGCIFTVSDTINQPTPILTSSVKTNVLCNGGSDGTATVSASGGTGAYTYSWTPVGGTSPMATGLSLGSYTVTVTDVNSCQTNLTVAIAEPPALAISTISKTDVTCNG
ncbi:MAG: SprB repeat-containing protein, partial [Bacteroidetes bacterium]|nr:SprB repeat-containing protein [Bacteroidota bacterium]